jgi:hypothetical protein
MKRIKAWWNRNSKKNNPSKPSYKQVEEVKCSECGQVKGYKGIAVKPEYINFGPVSGCFCDNKIKN